jgi:hypothetical protein
MTKQGKQPKIQSPIHLGATVFIRSVTHYYTGRIILLTKEEIVLEDAAWIADTGRFSEAMKTGTLNEVEPYASGQLVSVSRGGVVDVAAWPFALQTTVK